MATDQSQHLSDHPSQTLAINLLQNNHPMNVHGHVQNNSPHPSIQPAPMNHHFAGSFPYSQMPPNISNTMQNNPPIPKPTQPIPKKSAIIKTDRPRPHVCLTCTRAFARLEHLKRHERSHTNEKPFQCAACGRCFARRDLVLRHQQKLHAGLIANNPLTIVKTESQTEDKNLSNLPNNQSTTEAETGSRGRSKNFNSNIIEHKNNTDKIKPLPGQDALPPQLPKFKKVVPANKAALKQTSNPASKKQEKAPDYDQNLRMLQENRFMSDIPQISHFDGQNQMPEKLHHFDNYSQDQNNNLEKLHSNTENSSNSASTSPNDSLYNSNPFSPSSTLNSMSRTATNDAPPISLSSSSLNRVDSTGPTPNNIPLKRINSGKSAAAKLAAPPAPTANYENEDLLASFQMFGNKVFKKGAENNNNNDNNNSSNNNSNNNTENDESSHPPPPHHRHASFSAASAISYTLPEEAKTIHEHDFPEAPHQVGFSTPQMSATELAAKALLAGVDVDALGIDWESLENFSLNENNHDGHFFVNSDNTGKTNHFVPHEGATPYNMLYPSMEKSPNTPTEGHTNMFLDAPMLQEYLHVGGAGGGAGFDDSKSFKPLFEKHDVVRQVQKNESNENGEPLQDNWLDEFIKTPFDLNIDINHIGFVDSQDMQHFQPRQKQTDKNSKVLSGRISKVKKEKSRMALTDIPSLFRDRQIDLFQQQMGQSGTSTPNDVKSAFMSQASSMTSGPSQTAQPASSSNMQSPNSLFNAFSMHSSYPANFNFDLFTKDIRNHILSSNHLNDSQFPSIGELNSYIFLYCKEFDNYFPFVHLPLAESSVENIPLLLAVAAIGALYSFHSSNSILLFGVSKYYIHNFLESNKNCRHDDIPLWLIQCLTLNMFLGIFNNDESLNKSIAKQLNSLIYLVKKCSLHMPLEQFVTPPPVLDNNGNNNNTPLILKNNFDYFILAQSRIRTVHTILLISVLFDTLIGAPIVLKSEDIKCGSPCFNEELWKASNYQKWFQLLMSDHVIIDSKFTLIQLSNGESFNELLISLSNHNYMDLVSKKVGLKTLLSLLMNIHQSIYEHRIELDKQSINPNIKAMKWRMNDRLELESLLKYWELLFIKNEGVLIPNQSNLELINKSPVLKLILPLLSFAKIRLCLSVTPILEKVWIKDWEGMNEKLANIESDPEALRESAKHALSIIELWIDLISVFNDAQKTSRKTPIFFLTCTFTAILFLSEYLYAIELLIGTGNNTNDNDSLSIIARKNILTAVDTALFMRVSNVLKKVSTTLTPESANTRTFLEFLKIQANGALDFDNLNEGFSACAINNEKHNGESQADMDRLVKFIKSSRLSSKCLYLGVRILADAPIWPAAVLFAEALKARSMAISKTSENTPGSVSSGG